MDISVIIGTRNRASLLGAAFEALRGQELPETDRLEVVVVDDASTDETPLLCRKFGAEWPALRPVRLDAPSGVAVARNRGLAGSRGEIVLFTDDDCRPAPDWVLRMRDGLERASVVAGAVGLALPGYIRFSHHLSAFHQYLPRGIARPIPFLAGANMGFRREALASLGPFDPALRLAQDFEFGLRARSAGREILFLPTSVVWHETPPMSLRQAFEHTIAHAAATILIRNRYGRLFRASSIYRSRSLFGLCSPALALGATLSALSAAPKRARALTASPLVFGLKIAWCWGAFRSLGGRRPWVG